MTRTARLGIACLALPALALAAADPWLRITSSNFELFTTAGERTGRDLIRHFEQVRSFFLQAFGKRLRNSRPARLIVFRSAREYAAYRPNEFAAAFYQPGDRHDFIVMSSGSKDHYPVAVHEFTHLMVHQSGANLPAWLNEGLAELYSNLEPAGAKILVGKVPPGRAQTLLNSQWIDLHTLLAVEHNSPYYNEKSRAGMFYSESWALVHMLNLNLAYRPRLSALVAALNEGDAEQAFVTAYGKRIDNVQEDLRGYLKGNTINAAVFDIQLPKAVDAPEIETGASFPARLALAELLANYRGKLDQARAAYQELAKDYPGKWEVEDGWARLNWRERKLEDAARHFARAAELGCTDPQVFLEHARILGYTGKAAEAVAVLKRVTDLSPAPLNGMDEFHFELGTLLVRTNSYGEALTELRAVQKVAPDARYRYFYNMAYAEYRLGQIAAAREHIAKAREYARKPEEKVSVDRLEQALERALD